jgi:hypothetical protein
MNTTGTTQLAAMAVAVLMTVVTNGTMLWQFDSVAQDATWTPNNQSPTMLTLDKVTIVTQRS